MEVNKDRGNEDPISNGSKKIRSNRSVSSSSVIPVLIYKDVGAAADWLCGAFGFRERLRAGNGHAQLVAGSGAIMLGAERTGQGGGAEDEADFRQPPAHEVSQYVHVNVDDVDRHCEQAKAYGAVIILPLAEYPYGERQYTAVDPGGHRWTFSQSVADVHPSEWGAATGSGFSEADG